MKSSRVGDRRGARSRARTSARGYRRARVQAARARVDGDRGCRDRGCVGCERSYRRTGARSADGRPLSGRRLRHRDLEVACNGVGHARRRDPTGATRLGHVSARRAQRPAGCGVAVGSRPRTGPALAIYWTAAKRRSPSSTSPAKRRFRWRGRVTCATSPSQFFPPPSATQPARSGLAVVDIGLHKVDDGRSPSRSTERASRPRWSQPQPGVGEALDRLRPRAPAPQRRAAVSDLVAIAHGIAGSQADERRCRAARVGARAPRASANTSLLAEFEGQDTSEAWTATLPGGRAHRVTVRGRSVQGAGISFDGGTLLVEEGALGEPASAARVSTIAAAGGRPTVVVAHGGQASWTGGG